MRLTVLISENEVVSPSAGEPCTWTPPLDAGALRSVLERIKEWRPLDIDEVLDDRDLAIGNQTPSVDVTGALIDRLRGHVQQLSDIALADVRCPSTAEVVQLVERGVSLQGERPPVEHRWAVGLARRLAFVTYDLLEIMIEARYVKDAQ